jgi:N-acetylglucosamine-6-phosphate deacetylase
MRFTDLQVNGYAGVDFNDDDLSPEMLHGACEALREDGVEAFLPTVVTDTLPALRRRLARLADLRDADPLARDMIWGIHLEGPFLSSDPGYAGAHPVAAVREADGDTTRSLLDAARGLIRLVTLAPERDPGAKVTRLLADRKILVAAGHCNATRDELHAAIDNGLTLFTHFGNGCPAVLPRHDNVLQRALGFRERFIFTMIADGVHIPPFVLKNYLDFIGSERSIIVTDAIAAARLGPGEYRLGSQTVRVGADLVARAPAGDHLMGSTATMPRMATLLRQELGVSESEIERMTNTQPLSLLATAGCGL